MTSDKFQGDSSLAICHLRRDQLHQSKIANPRDAVKELDLV